MLNGLNIPFAFSGRIKTFFLKSNTYPNELLTPTDNGFRFELDVEERIEKLPPLDYYKRVKMPRVQRVLINRGLL